MSDAEHVFDPHWPHGHDVIFADGSRAPARIIPGRSACHDYGLVVEWQWSACDWALARFDVAGAQSHGVFRLINRPAPKPVVVDTKQFTIEFASASVRDAAGLPIRANVRVECEFISDGTVRASAEVVK